MFCLIIELIVCLEWTSVIVYLKCEVHITSLVTTSHLKNSPNPNHSEFVCNENESIFMLICHACSKKESSR